MPDLWMDVDTALSEVPVNVLPLVDDSDFKTREEAVAYNAAGLELIWHFTTPAGLTTATVVTPTTGGDYDWTHQDGGAYTIEMPASGGASANNDTEGFGWFTGVATGVLPWRGPVIGFRAAGLNDLLIESAYNAARGLAGTALDAILLDTGTDGVVLSAAQMNKIADHVIRRAWANVEASSDGDTITFRSLLGAIAKLVNKVAVNGSNLEIMRDDDSTVFGTQAITTNASAEPVTGLDTA